MSRSHDEDEDIDDEDDADRPRRRSRSDDDEDEEDEELDEEETSSIGGWRPFGEALFWGAVFLGLTVVAFSLGEGIGVKRPLADKEPVPEKLEPDPEPVEPKKKIDDSAFTQSIESPPAKDEEVERKLDLTAPPPAKTLTPVVDAKKEPPSVVEEPTTNLPWRQMLSKSQMTFVAKPKEVDPGPSKRTDFAAMIRQVELQPARQLLDVASLMKQVTIVSPTRRLDWASMLRMVTVEPATSRLDVDRMVRLVSFVPKAKPEPVAAPAPKPEPVAKAPVVPASLQLRESPTRLQVGKTTVLIARVVGADQQPLADQLVEWTLDRQGVGEILATPVNAAVAKPGERPLPIFARTYTAKIPHRIDAALGGAEIGVGETWIAVESASAGGMHAFVQAPAVSSPNAGRAGAHFHWDRAKAAFPEPAAAPAGTETVVTAKVTTNDAASAPLPDYQVRYTILDANGASFTSNQNNVEVSSRGDGQAPIVLKQSTPKIGATRGKVELLGRQPLSGRPSEVLAAGEFVVEWKSPDATVTPNGPSTAPLGEWVRIAASGSVKLANAANLRLHAVASEGARLQAASGDGSVDLGPWPPADGRQIQAVVRNEKPGSGSVRFEVRQGSHVWASAEHEIQFEGPKVMPSLRVSIKDSIDPAPAGGEFDYEVVVENQGSAPAKDVRVEFAPPSGLEFVSAAGSLGGSVIEGKYAPPSIADLPPGGRASVKLRVKAKSAGNARLVVRLHHASLSRGAVEEFEGTVVYSP